MSKLVQRGVALVVMLAVVMSATAYGASTFVIEYQELKSDSPVVMTINGDEVRTDEYASDLKYQMKSIENQYAQYGVTDLWNNSEAAAVFGPTMPESAKQFAASVHVIMQKMQELGLSPTYSQKKELANSRKKLIDSMGYEEYQKQLAQFGYTDQQYTNFMYVSMCAQILQDYYYGEEGVNVPSKEELQKYFEENYITAKHILISLTDPSTGKTRTDEEAKKLAQSILDRINAGEDFDTLLTQYNEDSGEANYPNGYTFTEGDMVDEFYNGAKALEEGEVSGLVKSDYGYHIIMRTALDESQMDSFRDSIVAAIAAENGTAGSMDELLSQWIQDVQEQVETNDVYDEITYQNVDEYLPAEVQALLTTDTSSDDEQTDSDAATDDQSEEQTDSDSATDAQTDAATAE